MVRWLRRVDDDGRGSMECPRASVRKNSRSRKSGKRFEELSHILIALHVLQDPQNAFEFMSTVVVKRCRPYGFRCSLAPGRNYNAKPLSTEQRIGNPLLLSFDCV